MNTAPTRHEGEIPALDGFRAIAVTIVILSHIGLQHVVPGQFGVTIFFFLSGYLITTLLRRELTERGRIDFRRFYLRRVVRILPPMYLTIAFFIALSFAGSIHRIDLSGLPYDFLFLTNYVSFSGIPIGLWSLAVEEHFYLAFPLMLALLVRRFDFARCALICLVLCAAVLAVRCWEAYRLADIAPLGSWTHSRIDSILFGSILALWNNPVADERNVLPTGFRGYALAVALLLPTFAFRDEVFRHTWRYSIQGLGLLVLFNAAIRDRGLIGQLLNCTPARWVALLSYAVYLVHSGLIMAFVGGHSSFPLLPTAAAIICTFGYAMAMNRWVESPLGAWRRRVEAGWAKGRATMQADQDMDRASRPQPSSS